MPVENLSQPPVIQMMPTVDLVVPDWNPRKSKDEGEMQALMNFIKAGGTPDRITVWKGNGQAPWAVISGQRRLEAYKRLGYEKVEVEILDITLEEAKRRARTANRRLEQNWLEDYESWEPYFKDPQFKSQEAIAAHVGVDSDWISRAVNLLAVLNPASRGLIREKLETSQPDEHVKNKGNNGIVEGFDDTQKTLKKRTPEKPREWRLAEDVAFRLTQFWDKCSQEEAQSLVEKCLPVILSRQMTAPQVDGLVKWVQAGNDPEDFDSSMPTRKKTSAPLTPPSPSRGEGQGEGERKAPTQPKAQPEIPTPQPMPIGAGARNDSEDLHSQIGSWIAMGQLTKKARIPHSIVNRLFPPLTRLFGKVIGLFEKLLNSILPRKFKVFAGTQGSSPVNASTENSVSIRVGATILAFFLVMFLGSTVLSHGKRLLGRLVDSWAYSRLSPAPQAGPQDLAVPSRSAGGNGGTQEGSATAIEPTSSYQDHRAPSSPRKAKTSRVKDTGTTKTTERVRKQPAPVAALSPDQAALAVADSPLAADFAGKFYSVSYLNWNGTMDYFRLHMAGDSTDAFLNHHFPPAVFQRIEAQKIVHWFKAGAPPKLLEVSGTGEKFIVQGEETAESRLNRRSEILSRQNVALVVTIRHAAGLGSLVEKAEETTVGASNEDPLKAVGDGVKDVSHAVHNASDALTAGADIKRQLGI